MALFDLNRSVKRRPGKIELVDMSTLSPRLPASAASEERFGERSGHSLVLA
jgi:hypothetical protein